MRKWQIALIATLIVVGLFLLDGGSVYLKQLINRPPKAAFTYRTPTRTLKFIVPTNRDLIMFLNNSTDPDGDTLTSQWYVRYNGTGDSKLLNSSTHHWGRLPVSNEKGHEIKLVVSDGLKEDSVFATISVDAGYLPQYPQRKLHIPFKGINFMIERPFEGSPLSDDEMQESLVVIKSELGCNAIRIYGGYEDCLLKCAQIADRIGFKVVGVSPRYGNKTTYMDIEEHVARVISFSKRLEEVRKTSNSRIVLIVGNELSIDVRGLVEGSTYQERLERLGTTWNAELNNKLKGYLNRLISEVKKNFKGDITYAAGSWEDVDWQQPEISIVGPNYYVYSTPFGRRWAFYRLANYKKYGKPIWASEFGCKSYLGASKQEPYKGQAYSQEEQASSIFESVDFFEEAGGIEAVFLLVFRIRMSEGSPGDPEPGYSIMRYFGWQMPLRRKLGFYAYQSFTLS